jgi:hypothetical protein
MQAYLNSVLNKIGLILSVESFAFLCLHETLYINAATAAAMKALFPIEFTSCAFC